MPKDDVRVFEKLNSISQMAPLKEKIRVFEGKYRCTLEEFERQLKAAPEVFEQWDEYLGGQVYCARLRDGASWRRCCTR